MVVSPFKIEDFNPRTPERGATRYLEAKQREAEDFNPRTPERGATTLQPKGNSSVSKISIHAPLSGVRQTAKDLQSYGMDNFNPRTPERGATLHWRLYA